MPARALFYGDGTNGTRPDQLAASESLYGKLWGYGSAPTYGYLASRGVKVVRLGFLWEHVQPRLGAPLDPTLLGHLRNAVAGMRHAGITVILDLHNYCGYRTASSGYSVQRIGQGVVSEADFLDLWTQLSTVFKDDAGVDGYGLMNEPADCYSPRLSAKERFKRWEITTQRLLTAIRRNGDTKRVFVPKMEVSGATKVWDKEYPSPWIKDPANNFVYEQHHYSDDDHSGTYTRSYAAEVQRAHAEGYPDVHARDLAYLSPFLGWCARFKAPCFLGEYGVPTAGPDAGKWASVASALLKTLDRDRVPVTWLGVGELWGHHFMAPYEPSSQGGAIDTAIPVAAAVLEASSGP
jgi:endoglucanase